MSKRRPRLPSRSYEGERCYFLTICCRNRAPLLAADGAVSIVRAQIMRAADRRHFEILAYCLMPDHVHLLVRGMSEAADLQKFVHQAKQLSAHAYRAIRAGPLWQRGYHDRVLRPHEPLGDIVRYILENPVRAGLVEGRAEYPYCGVAGSVEVAPTP